MITSVAGMSRLFYNRQGAPTSSNRASNPDCPYRFGSHQASHSIRYQVLFILSKSI